MRLIKSIAAWLTLLVAPLALTACGGGDEAANGAATATSGPPAATVKAPEGKTWSQVVEKTGEGWYRQGNPNAPVKLIEYGSRSCPVCGAFAMTGVEPLREKYVNTGKVSYEFRDFPVHAQDVGLTLVGRCVASPDAFFPVLDQMFAQQATLNDQTALQQVYTQLGDKGGLEAAAGWAIGMRYTDFMKQRGVTQAQLDQCLTQPVLETLGKQIAEAQQKGVNGTPTFFINEKEAPENTVSWQQLEPLLQGAGVR